MKFPQNNLWWIRKQQDRKMVPLEENEISVFLEKKREIFVFFSEENFEEETKKRESV